MADFWLYEKQRQYCDAKEPIRGFVGGQGCGKSKIGNYDLLMRALPGRLYMVVAPTYKMLSRSTFRSFREVAWQIGAWREGEFNKTDFTGVINTRTGGTAEVMFCSAENPDSLRGPNASGLYIDEASLVDHEAYLICVARLRERGERGWLAATFTPKGLGHWTYQVFGKEQPGEVFLVHASTKDNPFVSEEFLGTVYGQFGDAAAEQELEGRFVDADDSFQVIPVAWVRAAMGRWKAEAPAVLTALGVDVARGGRDKTIIACRHGHWWDRLKRFPGTATPDGPAVAGLVLQAIKPNPKALVNIDLDGPGGSPFDWLKRLQPGIRLFGVHGNGKVAALDRTGTHAFANARSYAYWSMRELLDPANKIQVSLPPDEDLLTELTAPRWEIGLHGIRVEPKDCQKPKAEGGKCCVKHRLGRSPDSADAVVYSILLPPGMSGGAVKAG